MAEVQWIKIVTNIFDDEKILLVETMPEADSLIVIWFKLLCLAGKQNNSGVFLINDRMPYTDEMFSAIFRRPLNTVRLALKTFERYGMIEIINDTVTIPNWGKHQNLDQLEAKRNYQREYMRSYREKQKQKLLESIGDPEAPALMPGEPASESGEANCKTNSNTNVSPLDKRREEKNREDKKREEKSGDIVPCADATGKPARHKYGSYNNVLLSDEDLQKLQTEFYEDWESRIERLSEYMASTGKSYKNHLATIRSWARKDSAQPAAAAPKAAPKTSGNVFLDMLDDEEGDWQ